MLQIIPKRFQVALQHLKFAFPSEHSYVYNQPFGECFTR